MADDFRRYEAMRDAGAGPRAACEAAKRDGLDAIGCIRALRMVFSLTSREVAEVVAAVGEAEADRLAGNLPGAPPPEDPCEDDFLPMDRFPLGWRWADPRWNELPPERLSRIRPLAASKAEEICGRGRALSLERRRDLFSRLAEYDDSGSAGPEPARAWLRGLPAAEARDVFVRWGREEAAVTDWGTFCAFWDDFCYPMSDVVVRPVAGGWALHYGRNERFTFGVAAEDRWAPGVARGPG